MPHSSFKMLAKGATLLFFLVGLISCQEVFEKYDPIVEEIRPFEFKKTIHMGPNADWNYDYHGNLTDWNFLDCNKTLNTLSPRDMSHENSTDNAFLYYDWNSYYYSFVP